MGFYHIRGNALMIELKAFDPQRCYLSCSSNPETLLNFLICLPQIDIQKCFFLFIRCPHAYTLFISNVWYLSSPIGIVHSTVESQEFVKCSDKLSWTHQTSPLLPWLLFQTMFSLLPFSVQDFLNSSGIVYSLAFVSP